MNILKRIIYPEAKFGSKVMEKVGKFFNWQGLQDEAKRNQDNPGRAVGKVAGYALGSYLGGILGGAGGTGGSAAADVASTGAGLGGSAGEAMAAYGMGNAASDQAIAEAMRQAAAQGGMGMGNTGLLPAMSNAGEYGSDVEAMAQQGIGNVPFEPESPFKPFSVSPPQTMLEALRYGGDSANGTMGAVKDWAANWGSGNSGMGSGQAKTGLLGLQMMQPQQQYQAPPPPPRQPVPEATPPPGGFGYQNSTSQAAGLQGLLANLTPEQLAELKRRGML